jgi:hypothetical protein
MPLANLSLMVLFYWGLGSFVKGIEEFFEKEIHTEARRRIVSMVCGHGKISHKDAKNTKKAKE